MCWPGNQTIKIALNIFQHIGPFPEIACGLIFGSILDIYNITIIVGTALRPELYYL